MYIVKRGLKRLAHFTSSSGLVTTKVAENQIFERVEKIERIVLYLSLNVLRLGKWILQIDIKKSVEPTFFQLEQQNLM